MHAAEAGGAAPALAAVAPECGWPPPPPAWDAEGPVAMALKWHGLLLNSWGGGTGIVDQAAAEGPVPVHLALCLFTGPCARVT